MVRDMVDDALMQKEFEARGMSWPLRGFAPGHYFGRCHVCERQHMAAKSAWHCLPCAVIDALTAPLPAPPPPCHDAGKD